MVNRIVSVGDDFTLPTAVKIGDANLPAGTNAATVSGKLDITALDAATAADITTPGTQTATALDATFGPDAVATASRPAPPRLAKAQVVFTFDDGYTTDLTVVKPILDAKGVKGSFAVPSLDITTYSGRLTWAQVRQLRDAGHEILDHSSTHTNINTTDAALIAAEVDDSYARFLANGVRPVGYVWPFQASSIESQRAVRKFYRFALGGSGATVQPLGTYTLNRTAFNSSSSLATLKAAVDTAKTSKQVLVFLNHSGTELDATGQTLLADLITYIQAQAVEIVTAQQAFENVGNVFDTESTVIDGAGRLFAPGLDASLGVVGPVSPSANVTPGEYTAGKITYQTVSSASNTTWPLPSHGNIITNRPNAAVESYTYQWFISSTGATRIRRGVNSTTWGAWQGPTHNNLVGLATATDDPITAFTEGTSLRQVYLTGSTAPGAKAGLVITHRAPGTAYEYSVQEFHPRGGGEFYRRMAASATTWTAWKLVTETAI